MQAVFITILAFAVLLLLGALMSKYMFKPSSMTKPLGIFKPVRQQQEHQKPDVLYFQSSSCPACNNLDSLVSTQAQKYGLSVLKVDPKTSPDLFEQYAVTSMPHLIGFKKSSENEPPVRYDAKKGVARFFEELTDTNKTQRITEEELERLATKSGTEFLVLFYADWCGFCKRFLPEYVTSANKNAHVPHYIIDGPNARESMKKHNVNGFPTVFKVGTDGQYHRFIDRRTAAALQQFITTPV